MPARMRWPVRTPPARRQVRSEQMNALTDLLLDSYFAERSAQLAPTCEPHYSIGERTGLSRRRHKKRPRLEEQDPACVAWGRSVHGHLPQFDQFRVRVKSPFCPPSTQVPWNSLL